MVSARRRHSLAVAPSPPLSGIPVAAGGSAAVAAGGRAVVAGAGSAAVAAGGSAAVVGAGSTAVTGADSAAVAGAATSTSAMFRLRRPLSTVAREPGIWSGSAEASPFSQFAPARLDMEREGDQSRSRQMQEDLFNCEQIDAEKACTGLSWSLLILQKLKQRSTIEAMDYLMAKKKEADDEKDLKKEERCKKDFALQEERLKLDKDKFEFKRDLEEERILNLDLTTMSYNLQQFYAVRQQEILARRCNM